MAAFDFQGYHFHEEDLDRLVVPARFDEFETITASVFGGDFIFEALEAYEVIDIVPMVVAPRPQMVAYLRSIYTDKPIVVIRTNSRTGSIHYMLFFNDDLWCPQQSIQYPNNDSWCQTGVLGMVLSLVDVEFSKDHPLPWSNPTWFAVPLDGDEDRMMIKRHLDMRNFATELMAYCHETCFSESEMLDIVAEHIEIISETPDDTGCVVPVVHWDPVSYLEYVMDDSHYFNI